MMRLQSKKVGIMLKTQQLSDTRILNEINRMIFEGAEVLIILLGEKEEQENGSFPALFRKLAILQTSGERKKGKNSERKLDEPRSDPEESLFDLLVFIPCTGKQVSMLTETIPRDYNGLPLVVAPVLEKDPHPPFGDISLLLEIEGIYFVPFGPLTREKDEKKRTLSLFSRLDLLTESCIAALEGQCLKHSFWENNFFPG